MSRNIHDVERHGTLLVQTDPDADEVWHRCAGMDVGRLGSAVVHKHSDHFDPRDLANLSHIKQAMSALTDEELQQMVKNGMMAQVALKARRQQRITTDEVDHACQSTINF
ncbi:hypothetical protein pEaSNUABM13_00203 [Erwinia phage pEa_SNUABM_13]|nr:hypothetical protein pEaSNUABM13_00203 [Erwinia phage pEa_SNUABM_13]QYW05216.1 hypothetical protein pEaSNUABM21_00202 [Erwinia phage pEa_SNUABM_21]QYW05558.1 hypothetical protein pEaSNUABM25_00202 [Erwinia phage pEa_SNUABM_25]